MPLACFDAIRNCFNAFETCRRHVPTLWCCRLGKFCWAMGGLFDEMGVLHVVEAGVEEADLGDYWQGEE